MTYVACGSMWLWSKIWSDCKKSVKYLQMSKHSELPIICNISEMQFAAQPRHNSCIWLFNLSNVMILKFKYYMSGSYASLLKYRCTNIYLLTNTWIYMWTNMQRGEAESNASYCCYICLFWQMEEVISISEQMHSSGFTVSSVQLGGKIKLAGVNSPMCTNPILNCFNKCYVDSLNCLFHFFCQYLFFIFYYFPV